MKLLRRKGSGFVNKGTVSNPRKKTWFIAGRMTEKCTTKHKMSPWTITNQPLCHPPRITMQAQKSVQPQKETAAAVCTAVSPCQKYWYTWPPEWRHYKVYQQHLWQCMGCFTLRPLCMQYLLTIQRPRKDVPWHKAYLFLGLLGFAHQKLNLLL